MEAQGSADAPPDGVPVGPLTPDPGDPVSLPCTGLVGFPNPGMVPANSASYELVVGDVNGDGKTDAVFRDNDGVKLALGNGTETFGLPTLVTSTTVGGTYARASSTTTTRWISSAGP